MNTRIAEYREKVKGWCVERRGDLCTAAIIFLVGMGGFGLGRLSVLWPEKNALTVTGIDTQVKDFGSRGAVSSNGVVPSSSTQAPDPRGTYIGSKSGSAYHYPWCPGAQKIKEENKIWFATKEEAVQKGYKPAGNCPGL